MNKLLLILLAGAILLINFVIALLINASPARPTTLVDLLREDQALWDLPSCPRELTLQDGTRWALPAWSAEGCESTIIYTVRPY